MRKAALALSLLLGFVALATPLAASMFDLGDWKTNDSGWSEFDAGSMVRYRVTRERRVPGMREPVVTVTESERTLVERGDGRLVFRTKLRVAGEWQPAQRRVETQRTYEVRQEASPAGESITVEGKPYLCKRIAFTRYTDDGAVDDQLMAWIHDEHGLLKSEQELAPGTGSMLTYTVTKFDVERTIGDTTLRCQEFSIEGPGTRGSVIVSSAVPGRIVELDVSVDREGTTSNLRRVLTALTTK